MEGSEKLAKNIRIEKNLSDAELQLKLDLYSQGGENQFFKIQKIKKSYLNQLKQQQDLRSKSDINFALGIRAGLPHAPYDSIQRYREDSDQKLRDQIIEEAKSEYRKHENLGKEFKETNVPHNELGQSDPNKTSTNKPPSPLRSESYSKVNGLKPTNIESLYPNGQRLNKYFSGPSKETGISANTKAKEIRGMDRNG